jgi:hypothetical protein
VISKYGIKTTCKRLAYLPENLGKRLSIDETALSMANSYYFDQQQQKEERNHSSYDCWN